VGAAGQQHLRPGLIDRPTSSSFHETIQRQGAGMALVISLIGTLILIGSHASQGELVFARRRFRSVRPQRRDK
jgi:hypothetical protein